MNRDSVTYWSNIKWSNTCIARVSKEKDGQTKNKLRTVLNFLKLMKMINSQIPEV